MPESTKSFWLRCQRAEVANLGEILRFKISHTCALSEVNADGLSDNLTAIVDVWQHKQITAIDAQLAQLTSTDVLA